MRTLRLLRNDHLPEGIFGELVVDENLTLQTIEHAYAFGLETDKFEPKVPPGVYSCKLGSHQLHSMKQPFQTFEITGVEGHSNILFHTGNTEQDSEGCVLLGMRRIDNTIIESRMAFQKFMNSLKGVQEFELEVSNAPR